MDVVTVLRRLAHIARLQETLPGVAAVDANAGQSLAEELATTNEAFDATRGQLTGSDHELVEQARRGLVAGWLDSTTLDRLAADPDGLRSWIATAGEIDRL